MNQTLDNNLENNDEISIGEIIGFFVDNWQKMALGSVLGLMLGVLGWFAFVEYKAELIINNITIDKTDKTEDIKTGIDFISWRNISKNLPTLAADLVEKDLINQSEIALYKKLSDPKWWSKNILPTYTISKSDAKDLAGISKELQDSAGTSITNLIISDSEFNKQQALDNVEKINQFIRKGAAFFNIKETLNSYESEALSLDSNVQQKVTNTEVELQYLINKAKNLEDLRQRFPQNVGVSTQNIIDPKDAASKYLPISTQLVAINTDIYNIQESLERLKDALIKNTIIKAFIEKALPLVNSGNKDGFLLIDQLIQIEEEMRSQVSHDEIKKIKVLNEIRANLISTKTRFSKFLESFLAATVSKPSVLLPSIGGIFAGIFLGLFWALGVKAWKDYRLTRENQMT